MELSHMGRLALTTAVIFVLAGCGGAGTTVPQGATTQSRAFKASYKGDLLYLAGVTPSATEVDILTYPQDQLVGTITLSAAAHDLCSDTSGNVWVVAGILNGESWVYEYAHGGTTPIKTLDVGNYVATGCSVDPATGNLAVVVYSAGVIIFPHGSASGTRYGTGVDSYLCGYDDKGNLFVDGFSNLQVAELPRGSSQFTVITLDKTGVADGGIHWDGKYMAISTSYPHRQHVIYRFRISGSSAEVVQTVYFRHQWQGWKFWVQGHTMVAPTPHGIATALWNYPSGGKPYESLSIISSQGVTVSVAPSNSHIRR
jgi:hypothetical protein